MSTTELGPLGPEDLARIGRETAEFAQRKKAAEETQLLSAFQAAMAENPDLAGERDRLVKQLQLADPNSAPTDLDVLRRLVQHHEARQTLPALSPMLRDRLKEVRIAKLVPDELGKLKVADGLFDWIGRAWEQGAGQNELSDLLAKQALRRDGGNDLSPEDIDRIAELKLIQAWSAADNGWLDATVRTAAQITGPMIEATAAGAGLAGTSAALGGPIGAGAAFAVGAGVDVFARSAYREFGSQYDQTYTRLIDAGVPAEQAHAIAMRTAAGYGVAAGAVETGAHLLLLKPFAGAARAVGARLMSKAFAEQGLAQMTQSAAAKTFLRELLTSAAAEPVEEGIQQALSAVADNLAASLAGKPEAGTTFGQALGDIGDAMYQTAKGMALIAPLGPAIHYMAQQRAVTRAKAGAEFLTKLGEHMAELKVTTRSPDAAAELINAVGEGKDLANVYVPADKLAKALEQTGHTREQFARDLPGAAQMLAQAEKTGDDVAIPIGDYTAKIAQSTLGPVLAPSVRVEKDGYSLDQAEQWLAEKEANQKATAEKIASLSMSTKAWNDEADAVERRMVDEIAGASTIYNADQRRMLAMLHRRYVETQALEEGMTPAQYDEKHRLSVQAGPASTASALDQFAGVTARTANLFELARARKFEAEGKDAATIWKHTGWARGADGQWRFEIDDSELKFKRIQGKAGIWNAEPSEHKDTPLGDLIEHPRLFDAYPWLADIPVRIDPGLPAAVAGEVSGVDNAPQLRISLAPGTAEKHRVTLVHEIQHVIQAAERFARGGTPSMFSDQQVEAFVRERRREFAKTIEASYSEDQRRRVADFEQALAAHQEALKAQRKAEVGVSVSENDHAMREALAAADRALAESRTRLTAATRDVNGIPLAPPVDDPVTFFDMQQAQYERYLRLAGEVEARNAARRADMPAATKQGMVGLPEDTEDRARQIQQIIGRVGLRKDEGVADSYGGAPGNPADSNILNQPPAGQGLIAVHNLSPENLKAADEIGGLAVPSIAVLGESRGELSGFGGITLIGGEPLASPDAGVPAFPGDAWTVTFPRPDYSPRKGDFDAFRNPIADWAVERGMHATTLFTLWGESKQGPTSVKYSLLHSPAVQAYYLSEVLGQPVEMPMASYAPEYTLLLLDAATTERIRGDPKYRLLDDGERDQRRAGQAWLAKTLYEHVKQTGSEEQVKLFEDVFRAADGDLRLYALTQEFHDTLGLQRAAGKPSQDLLAKELIRRVKDDPETAGKFASWVDASVTKLFGAPYLGKGRNKKPWTLPNIVDAMTDRKTVRAQQKDVVFGGGLAKASTLEEFKTLEDMRAAAEKHMTESAADAIDAVKASDETARAYREEAIKFWAGDTWEGLDASMRALSRALRKAATPTLNTMRAALRAEGFHLPSSGDRFARITQDEVERTRGRTVAFLEQARDAALTLRDVPTPYFEAKPQRAVKLSEFKAALVSEDTPQEARDILAKHNIPVTVYTSAEERKLLVRSLATQQGLLFQGEAEASRGKFDPDTNTIFLNPGHDATTLLHEFSHYWLTTLFRTAALGEAGPSVRRRAQVVLDWFGVKDLDAWFALPPEEQRAHHEAWSYRAEADWFGQSEGPALTVEQARAMRSFGRWVRAAYRDARSVLNEAYRRHFGRDLPALTPEVKQVFDRMIASEDAVEAAQVQRDLRPLFTLDARPQGATDAEWNAYQLAATDGSAQATETLMKQSLRAVKWLRDSSGKVLRKFQAAARAARKAVRAEEQTRLENEPLRVAEQRLRHGTIDDNGNVLPFKLHLDEFRASHTEAEVAALGTGPSGMLAANGMPADLAAQMLGFPTGQDLIAQLLAMPAFEEELEQRTDARMLKEHADLADPETMQRAVEDALHNEARLRMVAAELRWLAKVTTPTQVMVRAARAYARDTIGAQRVGDVSPHEHAQREVRARRNAERALIKGDHATAVVEKRRELIEAQMEREALDVREEIDKLTELLRKLFRSDKKLGKTRNVDYVAIARALAADLGLAPGEKTGSDYTAALRDYDPGLFGRLAPILDRLKEWAADGLAAGRVVKDWRDLSVDEFRDMHETIGALWRKAKADQELVIAGKAVVLDEAAGELKAQEAQLPPPKIRKPKSVAAALKRLAQQVVRPEHWAFRLDGAEKPGAFTRLVWRPVREAVDAFNTARNVYTKRAVAIIEALVPKLRQGLIEFRGVDGKLLHVFGGENGGFGAIELVGALLHTGNEGNFRRLIVGRGWGAVDKETGAFDASNWTAFLADMVTKGVVTEDVMDAVQALRDLVEELKPGAQRAHRALFGYYFEEIEATPQTFTFGLDVRSYRGGYMPAKLDRSAASAMRVQSLADIEQDARQQFATTGRGFTKNRVENFAEPLLLDLRLVPSHIDDVLRFTHIQPAIRGAERLLKHPDIAPQLEARQPGVWNAVLLPWLQRVASQSVTKRGRSEDIDAFWRGVRSSVGLSTMFGNLPNTLQQLTGLFPAALKVPPKYLFRGLWRWLRGGLARDIAGKSPFMAHRQHNQTMEAFERLNDLVANRSKFAKARAWARQHGYFLQSGLQNLVDSVVWHGAYEHAIDTAGREVDDAAAHAEAVKRADAAVRMTQGSFDPTDAAGYEEGTPAYRIGTMFSGYFNMLANLQGDQFARTARKTGIAKAGPAFAAYLLGFALPMLLGDAIAKTLRGQWQDDDDDGDVDALTLDFLFLGQLRSLAAEIPVAGPAFVAPAINVFDNQPFNDRMTTSPAVSLLERTFGTAARTTQKALGAREDRDGVIIEGREIRDIVTLLGVMFGVPTGAVAVRLGYARDVQTGRVQPQGAGEVLRALLGGTLK